MRRVVPLVNRLFARMSIGALFTAASVSGIVLFAVASSLAVSWVGVREARSSLYTQGEQLTSRFADQSRLALLYGSPENARDAASGLLAFPQIIGAGIYDTTGRALLETGALERDAQPTDTPVSARGVVLEADSDAQWRFRAPVYGADADHSPFESAAAAPELLGWVRVVQSKSPLAEVARGVVLSNLAVSFTIAGVLGLLAWRVTLRITTPIRALAGVMTRARAGTTGVRAGEDGPAELRAMEQAFNGMMDVLEQREADLRTARDAAMEAARAKAQFAAHVSHELRTPLNGLLGMLQLLDNAAGNPRHDEYLRTALSSGRTLLAVINDILDFSRGEAGRIELEPRTFALHARMHELVELLRPLAAAKGLALELGFGPDVPEAVVGDPTRLGQVLTNLLGNAIKFTARGTVRLRVTREPQAESPPDRVALRIEVQDTGIGIPAEALEQIFESFAQASSATARDFGGSGLGLTIARQLVDLMGGRIGVLSTPGQGSTFWVTLTLPVAAHSVSTLPLHGLRVLAAVEGHDHTVRELLGRVEALGAEVVRHTNGGEVLLAAARAHEGAHYDAALLSPALPEMRATELAQYLARLPGRERFRVLLITAPDEPVPAGVDAIIPTGADDAAVVAALRPQTSAAVVGVRVLVVEDDPTSQLVARGLLEQAGCEVTCVGNGQAALDALRAGRFDLVFMDVNMPGMDGLTATRALRALPAGAHVPVIAMTANAQPQDVTLTRSAGMDDFVAKPVQRDAIAAILHRWAARARTEPHRPDMAAVDPRALASLRETLGERVTAIVQTFLDDAATLVRDIHAGAAKADHQRLRERAHRLKGAARNVGAVMLADAADAVEKAPEAASRSGGTGLLRALDTALAATQSALRVTADTPAAAPAHALLASVLVVEDDRSTRMTLRALLEADGYTVTEAEDGREALAMFERQRPDLVLMDAMLPVLDGFAACREISAHTPVLMITSLDDEVSVERAFRAGAADFIPKPINVAVLRRRVERLVSADVKARDAERLAWHDALTGLINRGAFRERVAREADAASRLHPCAVLYLDLDRFKRINDTLGHELGDALLVDVAGRLRGCLPEAAVLARVGSDEFAAVFPCHSADDAGQAAGRVVATLGSGVRLRGHEVRVSASVGVALSPADTADADALINYAETAATRAKEEGGNGVQFYQARMSTQLRERLTLEADLRQAIERDQLVVFYQPQVDIAGGRVRGVEALVRWRHPVRGLVQPNDFIPLAEETGLIGVLGEWVLREACVQARRWTAAGLPALRMGVNVSARQLAAPEFVDMVAHALREAAFDPASLELEVTESVLMRDRDAARALLERLRALGVRIAIDDFGTGYSSLGYLKHLPVNTLKIDRTFVSGLPVDPHDVAITTGVLNLARNLGIEVVAEGVETSAQLRFLREYGCTLAQGYLFHAPMPASAFESWLATRPTERRRGA